jgi:hypothetical protein
VAAAGVGLAALSHLRPAAQAGPSPPTAYAWGCRPGIALRADARRRPGGIYSQPMDDPQVPLAEPPSAPRWALVDVVAAALTGLAWATAIAVSGRGAPAGPGWTAARYLAAGAACASLIFRWRFPVAALGVASGSAALFDALAGHLGVVHGSALALIPYTLAV